MNRHNIPDIDIRATLAARGLECQLLTADQNHTGKSEPKVYETFAYLLCSEIKALATEAFGHDLTACDLTDCTWAIVLREIDNPSTIVACVTMRFFSDIPSYFATRVEAVHPKQQRTGLGRLLYECITIWTRFLLLNDPIVTEGILRSKGDYCLVSYIEAGANEDDNKAGHGTFLKKLGFVRAQHDFQQNEDEIAFQRSYHVPVIEATEEAALSFHHKKHFAIS